MSGVVDYLEKQGSTNIDKIKSHVTDTMSSLPASRVDSVSQTRSIIVNPTTNSDPDLSFHQILDRSADFLAHNYHSLQSGSFNWQQAFSGQNFNIPLSLPALAQQSDSSSQYNAFFWGSFDYSDFHNQDNTFYIDGNSITYSVGLDFPINSSLLAGAVLAHSNANTDYRAPRKIGQASDTGRSPMVTKPVVTRVWMSQQALPERGAAIFRGALL